MTRDKFLSRHSDPDYYDLEFREQNPDVYGDDECIQDYYGPNRSGRNAYQYRQTQRRYSPRYQADRQFHEEFMRWRRNNPDKIAFFREESKCDTNNNNNDEDANWLTIVFFLIIFFFMILVLM